MGCRRPIKSCRDARLVATRVIAASLMFSKMCISLVYILTNSAGSARVHHRYRGYQKEKRRPRNHGCFVEAVNRTYCTEIHVGALIPPSRERCLHRSNRSTHEWTRVEESINHTHVAHLRARLPSRPSQIYREIVFLAVKLNFRLSQQTAASNVNMCRGKQTHKTGQIAGRTSR